MLIIGIAASALFSAFTYGDKTLQATRENLRATQILLEKVETIRLYSWDQINTAGFIPTNFTTSYDPNSSSTNVIYYGTMAVGSPPMSTSYKSNMLQITVDLRWTNSSGPRTREFITYVTRNGLQDYVY